MRMKNGRNGVKGVSLGLAGLGLCLLLGAGCSGGGSQSQFARTYVYVAESGNVAPPQPGAVAEFALSGNGTLTALSPSTVATGSFPLSVTGIGPGSGANWIAVDRRGHFAYVTNATDGTVSSFTINPHTGLLASLGPDVSVGGAGSDPIQVATDPSDQFVFVANAGGNSLSEFAINGGTLVPIATIPLGANTAPWTIAFATK